MVDATILTKPFKYFFNDRKSVYSCGAEVGVKIDIIPEVNLKGLFGLPFTRLLVRQMVHYKRLRKQRRQMIITLSTFCRRRQPLAKHLGCWMKCESQICPYMNEMNLNV